jgi:hypothetical protein
MPHILVVYTYIYTYIQLVTGLPLAMLLLAHLHLVPSGLIHISFPYLNAQHYEHANAEYYHHMPDRCEGQLRGGEKEGEKKGGGERKREKEEERKGGGECVRERE